MLMEKNDKTRQRIEEIQENLRCYYGSLKGLRYNAKQLMSFKKSKFAPRIIKYSCLPRSEKRFNDTIQNISSQVSLLERELAVLIEYGA